jgi:alpha-tubulin suppressor-like RCC1 family protein
MLALGDFHTCVLTAARFLACWGANDHGQLGVGDTLAKTSVQNVVLGRAETILHVAAAGNITCVVFADFGASCWGQNDFSQLGVQQHAGPLTIPLSAFSLRILLGSGIRVRKIVPARSAVCALLWRSSYDHVAMSKRSGVKCWGKGGVTGYGE